MKWRSLICRVGACLKAPKRHLWLSLCCLPVCVQGSETSALVVYPEVNAPFDQVFARIIEGIEERNRHRLELYMLTEVATPATFQNRYEATKPDIIIALGSKSYQFVKNLKLPVPVIVSAVFESLPEDNCICMNIEPELIFSQLKRMSPKSQRVYVVYNPASNEWMISNAKKVAHSAGIELIAKKASTPVEAAQIYKEILDKIGKDDAIWLPVDSIFPSSVILPEILQTAWDKRFFVLSTSPAYVKRGGFMALYPDNRGLGKQIVQASEKITQNSLVKIKQNSRHFKSAINIRTGRHLGIELGQDRLKDFDVVFPVN